ncbi:hypothetical protein NC651_011304 [Populus alba x Populus x berolinensis]|nr:hypothetical protein NC651_011304 [Populus alba x Populus x berolinensis]
MRILSLALVNDQLYANHKSPCFYFLVWLLFYFFHSVAAESNTPVWFEPVSVAKSRRIVSVAKYVTFASPNEDELIAMANALSHENMFRQIERDSNSRCSVESLFQFLKPAILVLLEKGIKIVSVTLGADGVFLCSRGPNVVRFSLDRTKKYGFSGQLYDKVVSSCPPSRFSGALQIERSSHLFSVHFPALPASVVRLTGAGDCLVGGTLASLCSGLDIMQSIAVGIAAAKSAVEGEANVPSEFSLATITEDARSIYSAAKIPFHQSTL